MASLVRGLVGLLNLIPCSFVALLARAVIGLVFFNSWQTKIDFATWSIKPATFFLFATEYRVPLIPSDLAAYMATTAEFVCPILIWLGLGTRFAAAALLGMTLVIQLFVYPNAYVTHGLWAVALLFLMRFGPGKISLDHLIATRYGGGRAVA